MTLLLPRLPATQPPWDQMQLWWQRVVEAIEAQEARQDQIIDDLAAANAALAAFVDQIVELNDLLTNAQETITTINETVAEAQEAITAANEIATTAAEKIEQIETGTLELEAVTVGGQKFINSGGSLVPEP